MLLSEIITLITVVHPAPRHGGTEGAKGEVQPDWTEVHVSRELAKDSHELEVGEAVRDDGQRLGSVVAAEVHT